MAFSDTQRSKPQTRGPQSPPVDAPAPMARVRRMLQLDPDAGDNHVIAETAARLEALLSLAGEGLLDELWNSKGNKWLSATNGLSSL